MQPWAVEEILVKVRAAEQYGRVESVFSFEEK